MYRGYLQVYASETYQERDVDAERALNWPLIFHEAGVELPNRPPPEQLDRAIRWAIAGHRIHAIHVRKNGVVTMQLILAAVDRLLTAKIDLWLPDA